MNIERSILRCFATAIFILANAGLISTSTHAQTVPSLAECNRLGSDVPALLKALALDPAQHAAKIKNIGPKYALPAVCYKLDLDIAIALQNCANTATSVGPCPQADIAKSRRASDRFCLCGVKYFSAEPAKAPAIAISPQCASLRDPVEQVTCETKRLREQIEADRAATAALEASTAALEASTAAAEKEGACVDDLKQLRETDATVVDRGRAILAGRKLREYGACNLLADLRKQ
jgi:hypothetical protein